jgi:geranylgeranyl pyrophosphate synthase
LRAALARSVVSAAAAFVDAAAPTRLERDLLVRAFGPLRGGSVGSSPATMGELAALSAAAVGAEEPIGIAVGAVAVIAGLGIDLLDDLADQDLDSAWRDVPSGGVLVLATALVSALAGKAIAELPVDGVARERMHAGLGAGLLEMSGGELDDVCSRGAGIPSPAAVEASVVAKSGGEMGLSAALGAIAAGASDPVVGRLFEAGRHYGVALQLSSDVHDLGRLGASRDLSSGSRTLPIAYHARALSGSAARSEFARLLDDARDADPARVEVLRRLRDSGALRRVALIAELHHRQAQIALDGAALEGRCATRLRAFIGHCSVYSARGHGRRPEAPVPANA